MTFARLTPVCSASGDKLNSYGNATRKDDDGRARCPVCGKTVKLRKSGLDRHPNTIPHHHDERGFSRGSGSSYPQFPGRKLGKPATVVSAPVAHAATKQDALSRFDFLGGLVDQQTLEQIADTALALCASAPVAGEADQKLIEELSELASDMAYEANQEMDQEKASRAAVIERGEHALRRLIAAPQAMAEPVGMVLDERRDTYRLAVVAPGMKPGASVYAAPQASEAVQLLRKVREDGYLSDTMNHRIAVFFACQPQASEAELKEAAAMARSFGAPDMADALDPATGPVQASEAVREPDYTLQHADHMAVSAERLMEAINARDALIMQREESDDVDDETMHDQHENVSEYLSGMRNAIYEYRKRRNRAALSAQPGAQKEGASDA